MGVHTHLITCRAAIPLMLRTAEALGTRGLVVEMTDGTSQANAEFRRNVGFYYDLVKANVERIVKGLSAELEDSPVTAVGVTPGWLRSEKMLENFGVAEANWRDACRKRPGFGISESPTYVARGVAALARASDAERWAGTIVSARQLADAYGVTDTDGSLAGLLGLSAPPTDGNRKTAAASKSSGKSKQHTGPAARGASQRLRLRGHSRTQAQIRGTGAVYVIESDVATGRRGSRLHRRRCVPTARRAPRHRSRPSCPRPFRTRV